MKHHQKPETLAARSPPPPPPSSPFDSIDPFLHLIRFLPFSLLRLPRLRLKLPTLTFPSPTTILALLILSYFIIVSGIVYDIIVEPPGIGSSQDRHTGAVRPVVFMPGRVNGQYIIEGLSSGFMFVMGGVGIMMMDLAMEKSGRERVVRVSYGAAGVSCVVIGYVMCMLFLRIKIPAYLS